MLALHCILMIIPSQTYCVGPIFVRATICRVAPLGFDQNWPSEVAYVKCVWLTYIKCAWLCEPVIRQQYYGNTLIILLYCTCILFNFLNTVTVLIQDLEYCKHLISLKIIFKSIH